MPCIPRLKPRLCSSLAGALRSEPVTDRIGTLLEHRPLRYCSSFFYLAWSRREDLGNNGLRGQAGLGVDDDWRQGCRGRGRRDFGAGGAGAA